MKVTVKNIDGKNTERKADLPDSVFKVEPNEHVVYLEVKRHLAAKRQGTHKTKERGELSGSRRKLRRQKGTGMARVGDIKSPIFRGGGRVFGPQPRDYNFKLNKKEKNLARKSALSQKAKDKQLTIVEDVTFEEPQTKKFAEIMNKLDLAGKKVVWISSEKDNNFLLSARNIPGIKLRGTDITTYDILNNHYLVITESAVKPLTEQISGK